MPDTPARDPGKFINLDARARFVPTELLRAAYLHYEDSRAPSAPRFGRNNVPVCQNTLCT